MLAFIKLVHTVVWMVMAGCVFYAIYAGFVGRFDSWFWIAVGLVVGETIVLIAWGWKCPLTSFAERYTDDRADTFDIYLPAWLARNNVKIFSVIIVAGFVTCCVKWLVE